MLETGIRLLVSIAIINYNNASFIERAIRSCQNQFRATHNLEIIVVDDASTDQSSDIIHQFKDSVRLFCNSSNKGAGFSSQCALKNANGKYFMRVDSDDFLSQYATGVFTNYLEENTQVDFVFGNLQKVDSFGRKLDVVDMSNIDNLIDHGAGILFRTATLQEIGGYNPELRHGEDIDLMLRLMKSKALWQHLPLNYYRYYQHGMNKSISESHQEAREKLRRKYEF